ncbi:exopolysaccharide biosynthesis polyprenyl glycosylphosphotransferase [Streptosporangium sp. NPDC048047]|uniref:exopolysaccharide biosynthesis polyprenyl glycosylphosphotransferase n=1 Tax=Streptosporangium sp. NPDC048047 TaxID=3155748 RepID=UPI00344364C0
MREVKAVPTGPGSTSASRPRAPAWARRHRAYTVATDLLCSSVAGLLALFARFGESGPDVTPYVALSAALPPVWVCAAALNRAYEPRVAGLGPEEYRRIARCGLALAVALASGAYLARTETARGYVVLAVPLATALALLGRYGLRRRLRRMRERGRCARRVVAAGRRPAVAELIGLLRRERRHGMEVVAACVPYDGGDDVEGVPVLGDLSDVPLAVGQAAADTVAVLACPELDGTALRRLAWRLERTGADLVAAPALLEPAGPRTGVRLAAGVPLLYAEHPRITGSRRVLKAAFDRAAAAALLAALLPLLTVLALAVRASGPGPVLLRRRRVGRDGAEFTLYTFRTMAGGAERGRVGLRGDGRAVPYAIRHDPRLTPLGARLRRRSLDELPQLLNVLLGHMSLVGPRPPLPEEVARYDDDVRRRLPVKPGMTGLWQLTGRPDIPWEESVRWELRYAENWSLTLDLQILWNTWAAVARGTELAE